MVHIIFDPWGFEIKKNGVFFLVCFGMGVCCVVFGKRQIGILPLVTIFGFFHTFFVFALGATRNDDFSWFLVRGLPTHRLQRVDITRRFLEGRDSEC